MVTEARRDTPSQLAAPLAEPLVLINQSFETFTPTASGAIATFIWELCREGQARGRPPKVITISSEEPTYPWSELALVPPYRPPSKLVRRAGNASRRITGYSSPGQSSHARQVIRAIKAAGADAGTLVLHNDPELATRVANHFRSATVVHWFHNPVIAWDRFRRGYHKASIRSIAVSRYVARAVEFSYLLGPFSVAVGHGGVDLDRFSPAPGPPRPVVFGFLGRTGIEKAPDLLLRASLLLSEERRDFAVQLVGSNHWGRFEPDDYQQELAGLVGELQGRGVEVRQTGFVARAGIPDALRATDVHVLTSRWDEPCALTLLEAMACGLPVIATSTGGTPEVIKDAGVLVPRDDPTALATAMADLLEDPVRRLEIGRQARRRARSFSWGRTWEAMMAVAAAG